MSPIANTIRSQINMIDPRAFWAWGVKEFVYSDNSLQFNSTGCCKFKGKVIVSLNDRDLYDIRYFRSRGIKVLEDVTVQDVYAEALVRTLDAKIG
jgi:hypothetical protein